MTVRGDAREHKQKTHSWMSMLKVICAVAYRLMLARKSCVVAGGACTSASSRRCFHRLYADEIMSRQFCDLRSGEEKPRTWSRLARGGSIESVRCRARRATREEAHHCKSCATLSRPWRTAMRENGLSDVASLTAVRLALSAEMNWIGWRCWSCRRFHSVALVASHWSSSHGSGSWIWKAESVCAWRKKAASVRAEQACQDPVHGRAGRGRRTLNVERKDDLRQPLGDLLVDPRAPQELDVVLLVVRDFDDPLREEAASPPELNERRLEDVAHLVVDAGCAGI